MRERAGLRARRSLRRARWSTGRMRRRSTRFAPDARAGRRDVRVRPYTVRKGDTLESIASKRSMRVEDVKKYNKSLRGEERSRRGRPSSPVGKVEQRDQQIIDGIKGVNEPRVYPCRGGRRSRTSSIREKFPRARSSGGSQVGRVKAGTKVCFLRVSTPCEGDVARVRYLTRRNVEPARVIGVTLARNALGAMIGVGGSPCTSPRVAVPGPRDQTLGQRSRRDQRRLAAKCVHRSPTRRSRRRSVCN